jgi:glycosyltransferase involved in cell wall biosynthesis
MARVSVVMSVFNGERFLREAVDSILGQTYRDLELIVIDDGSADGSGEILAQRRQADARLRVFPQANMGLTRSLNRGVELSTGEYVARMDADDLSEPRRFERQVAFMDAHPDVGLLGTAYREIDGEGRVLGTKVFPTDDRALRAALIRYNPFFHASVLLRREVFTAVGLYDPAWPSVEDYELWLRVAQRFRLANLEEPLGMRRYDGVNISIRRDNEQLLWSMRLRWAAIRRGQYPPSDVVHLARPMVAWLTPIGLRNAVRRRVLGRSF